MFVLTDPAFSWGERAFGLLAAVAGIGAFRSIRERRLGYPAAFLLAAVAGLVAWASSAFTNTGRLLIGAAGLALFIAGLLWALVPVPYSLRHRLVRLLGIVFMASAPALILLAVVSAWTSGTPEYAWRYGTPGTARLPSLCHYIQVTQYTGKRMEPNFWCPHATWYGRGGASKDVTLYLDVHEYQAINDGYSPTTIPARFLGGEAVTVERGDKPSVAIVGHIPHRWFFGGGALLLGILGLFMVDAGRNRSTGKPSPAAEAPEVGVRTTPPQAPQVDPAGTSLSACDLLSDGSIRAVFPRTRIVSRAITQYSDSVFVPRNGRCRIGLWLPHGDNSARHGPLVARIEVTVDAIGDVQTAKSRFAELAAPRPWRQNTMDTVLPVNFHGRTTAGTSRFLNDTVVPVLARSVLTETS